MFIKQYKLEVYIYLFTNHPTLEHPSVYKQRTNGNGEIQIFT